jgi:hypothetical protein
MPTKVSMRSDQVVGSALGIEAYAVLLAYGLGHPVVLCVGAGIVAPHDALQFRKLAYHAGHQIGLGEPGGALGKHRIGADFTGYLSGEQLHAFHALQLAAELVVIDDRCQLGHARLKAAFLVGLVEKARVSKAGPHHAVIAIDYILRVGEPHIADDKVAVAQFACGVEKRKIFLVGAHGEH